MCMALMLTDLRAARHPANNDSTVEGSNAHHDSLSSSSALLGAGGRNFFSSTVTSGAGWPYTCPHRINESQKLTLKLLVETVTLYRKGTVISQSTRNKTKQDVQKRELYFRCFKR